MPSYWKRRGTCSEPTPAKPSRSVNGLRVADTSIVPTMPSANTNAATLMIAEMASDLTLAAVDKAQTSGTLA
jgi:choline dehydrogenase